MALPKLSNVKIVTGRGKLRGRHCVKGQASKKAPGFKGKGSTTRFVGCFISKADAVKRAMRVGGGDFKSDKYSYKRVGPNAIKRSNRKSRR